MSALPPIADIRRCRWDVRHKQPSQPIDQGLIAWSSTADSFEDCHRRCGKYTVISGVFYIGLGDQFDGDKVEAHPPGSVIVLPGDTSHFHWAKSGEYVTQVTAIGPLGLEYLDPGDDPRR